MHICRYGIGPDEWLVLLVGAILLSVYFCRFCTSSPCPLRMPIFTAQGAIWALCCYMCCTFASVTRLLLETIPCLVPFSFAEVAQDLVIVPRFFSRCCYPGAHSRARPTHILLGKKGHKDQSGAKVGLEAYALRNLCNTTKTITIPFKSDFVNEITCYSWCRFVQTSKSTVQNCTYCFYSPYSAFSYNLLYRICISFNLYHNVLICTRHDIISWYNFLKIDAIFHFSLR